MFLCYGRQMSPGARPASGLLPLVAVGVSCRDHLVALLLIPIAHMRYARRFLARRNVSVRCV